MRYTDRVNTFLFSLLLIAVVACAIGWLRPVRVVREDDGYRAKYDSLLNVVRASELVTLNALARADRYERRADSLASILANRDSIVGASSASLHGAGVEQLQGILMSRP